MQKARGQPLPLRVIGLPQLASMRFRVLFHSHSWVLFNFPSRYYALSVANEYLALASGLAEFAPGFSCRVLLGNTTHSDDCISSTGLSPCIVTRSRVFDYAITF